jgi:hypothetical protein
MSLGEPLDDARLAVQNRSAVFNGINLESAAERRCRILGFSTPGKT